MFGDLDWPVNASRGLSATAEFLVTHAMLCVSTARAVALCPSVRPSVTFVDCIHMAEDNVKRLSRRIDPSLLFFWPIAPTPNSKGKPVSGAKIHVGWGKWAIFVWNRRLSRNRCEIGPWLLWNVNRKSKVSDRSVSVPMTLIDPNPSFKVTTLFEVEYLKSGVF